MADYEGRDTEVQGHEAQTDEGEQPIRMDMPDVERDKAGIPTFVFEDGLSEGDKPSSDYKTLEVVLLWREAVMSVGHYSDPRSITVGDHYKNDFRVAAEGLPVEKFPLIEADGDGFAINWTDTMALEVQDESGNILGLDSLRQGQKVQSSQDEDGHTRYRYKVGLNDRVAVQVGEVTFVVQYVSPARLITSSILKTIDYYFTKVLGLSFLAHLFAVLALLLTPINQSDLSEDLFKNPDRFAKLLLKEPEKAPKPKKRFELSGSKGGGKHKDKEGKFGKPKKEKKDALASKKGAPKVDPNKREEDRKVALESGIFKALKGDKAQAASDVLGPGGLGTGVNNALGGLRGTQTGDAGGAGGLGSRGTGPGGGGSSLGIGGLGDGSGRGTGGLGNVDLGGRGKSKYKVIPGRSKTKGCLTNKVVLRVLNRVQSQAKYCYEKELQRNPNLEGKVTTSFVIGPTGSVQSAKVVKSTMGNASVEQCLLRVVKRLRFPPCKGGGVADVTYPWIFKGGS